VTVEERIEALRAQARSRPSDNGGRILALGYLRDAEKAFADAVERVDRAAKALEPEPSDWPMLISISRA
jgi:hypothetical protein